MPELRYKFSVWSSTEFLESDYDFPWKKQKTTNDKKRKLAFRGGGGGLYPEGGYNRVYFIVADGVITGGSLEAAVYGLE